jgi:hypothetical protein
MPNQAEEDLEDMQDGHCPECETDDPDNIEKTFATINGKDNVPVLICDACGFTVELLKKD